MSSDQPLNSRATHRVVTPGLPPLYCLREADALDSAGGRGRPDTIIEVLVKSASGIETWEFWRGA